jgi:hypothetical protein
MYYYTGSHPSARHARETADISDPDPKHLAAVLEKYPKLKQARALEVVMTAGQMLYIPTYWNHYIISMGTNIQCNTRSGNAYDIEAKRAPDVKDCH